MDSPDAETQALAVELYGTDTDLEFVMGMAGRRDREEEIKTLLRDSFSLVQDPMSEAWIQRIRGLTLTDIIQGPPNEED